MRKCLYILCLNYYLKNSTIYRVINGKLPKLNCCNFLINAGKKLKILESSVKLTNLYWFQLKKTFLIAINKYFQTVKDALIILQIQVENISKILGCSESNFVFHIDMLLILVSLYSTLLWIARPFPFLDMWNKMGLI